MLLGLNVHKFNTVSYKNGKSIIKAMESPFYKTHCLVKYTESDNPAPGDYIYEVVSRKRKVTERAPVQQAHFILMNAKQRVLEFLNVLRCHFDVDQMKLGYMGMYSLIIDYFK